MTISRTELAQITSEKILPKFWLGYFQEAFREQGFQTLVEIFEHLRTKGFSKSDLATKIHRRPEQVTRWLSAPTNLEIDTISDLALGMGFVPVIEFRSIDSLFENAESNQRLNVENMTQSKSAKIGTQVLQDGPTVELYK